MMKALDNIRQPANNLSFGIKIRNTSFVLCLGLFLGLFSKILDCTPYNYQPYLFQRLDIGNFLGRPGIWILLAVIISIYSSTPIRAGMHVFLFFSGMLLTYYLYTIYVAGFFPKSYMMIWIVITMVTPALGFLCWYAKGYGRMALLLSSAVIGILFIQSFSFGMFYFDISYQGLETLCWLIGIAVLYKNPKQLAKMLPISLIAALICNILWI